MNERIFFFYGEKGFYRVWTMNGIVTEVEEGGPQEFVSMNLNSVKSKILPDYQAGKLKIVEFKATT